MLESEDKNKDLQDKNDNDHGKNQNAVTEDDFDDWKRLEKWQIGRKNFC